MESKNRQLSKVQDRLLMPLGANLSALNHTTIKSAIGEVVIQQETSAERLLALQKADLLQAAIYDSDLLKQLVALSSHRPRQSNHLALILEGLGALVTEDAPSLERFSKELNQPADEALSSIAKQLKPFAQKLDQS